MKTAKVIIGLVVGFFATITMFQMFFEETGAGLYGALSGYAVIIAICIWLVYSGTKDDSKTKVPNRNNKNVAHPISDKSSTLKELKDKGILTEQEYEEKLKKLVEDDLEKSLENYNEYKQLKSLYNDGILTKDEFENKVEFLKNKLRSDKEDRNKNEPSEGMILVTDDDLNYGFTDINGNVVIKTQYEYAEDFSEGLALVRLNSKFGYIDKKGNVVIDLQFEDAKSFQNGFAKVKRKNDTQFIEINKKGENTQKVFNEIFKAKTHTTPPKKVEKKSSPIKIILPIFIVLGLITYGVYQKSEAQKTINKNSIPYKSTPINITNNVTRPNNKEDSNTNFKTIIWENKDVKNFKFKLPNTFIYNSVLSSSNKNVYSDYRNNLALSIDVAELPTDYINAPLSELIPDINSFGREINAENKKQFYDFKLINTGYAKIGNANSILVNQTSATISESNQLMKVDSYFVISAPYYVSLTFSYPFYSDVQNATIQKIIESFNFRVTETQKIISQNTPSISETRSWFEQKLNNYLVEKVSYSDPKYGATYKFVTSYSSVKIWNNNLIFNLNKKVYEPYVDPEDIKIYDPVGGISKDMALKLSNKKRLSKDENFTYEIPLSKISYFYYDKDRDYKGECKFSISTISNAIVEKNISQGTTKYTSYFTFTYDCSKEDNLGSRFENALNYLKENTTEIKSINNEPF